ncbi:MAG: hypothetical protein GTO18_06540 [Anaerolineales bacterium]|nr:hypothetical protein [Anaerolineales bacterium]
MSKFSLYLFSYFLLLSFGFIILRYLVPRDYLKHGKLSPPITFLQALLFFVYGGFPYIYLEENWPAVSVPPLIHVAGVVLLFGGLGFLFYGMIRLGVVRSMGRGSPQLEQSGIYGVSRNPQAIACALYVFGFFMLWPSWYAAGWAFLYFVLIHMMVMTEEDHLRRKHGEEYQEYCERVPRYIVVKSFYKNPTA